MIILIRYKQNVKLNIPSILGIMEAIQIFINFTTEILSFVPPTKQKVVVHRI